MSDKKRKDIIKTISNVSGAAIGASLAALCPEMSIIGASLAPAIGDLISWIITEAKDKVMSKWERRNIAKALKFANASLDNKNDNSANKDWFSIYVDIVKNFSNDDILLIWGKILSREINNPDSISLRTMETIKNLSYNEAKTFEIANQLLFYKSDDEPILPESCHLQEFGIKYEDILSLIDAGLLSYQTALSYNVKAGKKSALYSKNHLIVIEGKEKRDKKISINVFPLTKAGRELIKILDWEEKNVFIENLCKELNENFGSTATFKVKTILRHNNDGTISFL